MPRQVFRYDPPIRFVAGTVGGPGERTFYLQARAGEQTTSVVLEKEQVAVLAERVEEILDRVLERSAGQAPIPAIAPADLADAARWTCRWSRSSESGRSRWRGTTTPTSS